MQGSERGKRQENEAEAARLLVCLQSEPSAFERSQIDAWIEANPAHAVAFAKAEAAWEQAERLKASGHTIDCTEQEPVIQSPSSGRYRGFMIGGMVAASLLVAGAGITTKMSGSPFGLFADPASGNRCNASPIRE
ncbi:MAG: FecR/PupR family sigma factor regulator [Sphingobium sp.]